MPEEPTDHETFEAQVQLVLRGLRERGGIDVTDDELEATVREVLADLRRAPVQDFVALLAERAVRERLKRP